MTQKTEDIRLDHMTDIVFILDRSGSMGGRESDTIGGYNSFLMKQKVEPGHARVSTILFDSEYEVIHDRLDIKEVLPITKNEYYVRGSTALLDAIGKSVYDLQDVHMMEGKTKDIQADEIGIPLQEYIFQEMNLIKKDLANSKLSVENQQFIQLYIDYYEGVDKLTVNKSIKNYKKTYPNTDYEYFLNLIKQYTSTSYINFCIGYGHEFLNGNISNSFDSHFQIMSLEIEGFVNQTYFSLFMNGSVGKIYSKIDMPVLKTDLTQKAGDEAFSLKYGVKLGRSWYSNKTFNAFSYLSLGGYQMNAQKSNFENSDSTTK